MKKVYLLIFAFFLTLNIAQAQSPILAASSVTIPQGGNAEVTYTVTDFWNICFFNGTLTWDPQVISFDVISFYSQPFATYPATYDLSQTANGRLSFTWAHPISVGATIPDGDPLIKIRFIGVGAGGTTSVLGFSNNPVPLYWYNFAAWSGSISTVDGLATIAGGTANPPVADFAFGGTGLYHVFANNSSGNPTSQLWDFGDGDTTSVLNPAHTYQSYGTYQACLSVSNANGSDSVCHMIYATMTVGIAEEVVGNRLNIIHDPDGQFIHIAWPGKVNTEVLAEVYSLQGQLQYCQHFSPSSEIRLNARLFNPGIWFVRVAAGGAVLTGKMLVP